jgi:hypothetical protein
MQLDQLRPTAQFCPFPAVAATAAAARSGGGARSPVAVRAALGSVLAGCFTRRSPRPHARRAAAAALVALDAGTAVELELDVGRIAGRQRGLDQPAQAAESAATGARGSAAVPT